MKQAAMDNTTQIPTLRESWQKTRTALEHEDYEAFRRGIGKFWIYKFKHQAILIFGSLLKATGFFKYGHRNALNLRIRHRTIITGNLPHAFKGYRILHLSDLHLDSMTGLGERIARAIDPLSCDLCVITGDFRYARHGEYRQILPPLGRILSSVHARDGIYAVLGNHDTQAMVGDMEAMGLRLLLNQGIDLTRGGKHIRLVGVDDPHDYYTEAATSCIRQSGTGFKILLAHSPEIYRLAAKSGIGLYLCGHSHGGQICLPGGSPFMTFLNTGKRFYRGLWQYGEMVGHTSPGCGTAKIPVRFNCPPEATVLELN